MTDAGAFSGFAPQFNEVARERPTCPAQVVERMECEMVGGAFYGTTAALAAPIPHERSVQRSEAIELQVDRVALLFDSLDPFPLPSRDIAKPVETFILDRARELRGAPLRIVIRVPAPEASAPEAIQLKAAVVAYFSRSAENLTRDLHELFRMGRFSLLIGLGVLAACTIGANAITETFASPLAHFVSEGLIILGWVANWRPIEIFLYEWWPLVRLRRLHRRIADASLEICPPPQSLRG
jgi:hypothetical protein